MIKILFKHMIDLRIVTDIHNLLISSQTEKNMRSLLKKHLISSKNETWVHRLTSTSFTSLS
jgi:hypothetical protein